MRKTVFVLNGPNLNLLGTREPHIYGAQTLADVEQSCRDACERHGLALVFRQSNHEGELVDWIHEAGRLHAQGGLAALVLNAAAYTHTSVAILDALKAVSIPAVEVHLTDIYGREEFRHNSYTSLACRKTIAGHGFEGYAEAMRFIKDICVEKKPGV